MCPTLPDPPSDPWDGSARLVTPGTAFGPCLDGPIAVGGEFLAAPSCDAIEIRIKEFAEDGGGAFRATWEFNVTQELHFGGESIALNLTFSSPVTFLQAKVGVKVHKFCT